MKQCQTCSVEFVGEVWQKFCRACYAKQAEGAVSIKIVGNKLEKDESILRQVCLKIASEQLSRAKPSELLAYAKEVRSEWGKWE